MSDDRVHNHGPEEGDGLACPESMVDGRLRGACMTSEVQLAAGGIVRAAPGGYEVPIAENGPELVIPLRKADRVIITGVKRKARGRWYAHCSCTWSSIEVPTRRIAGLLETNHSIEHALPGSPWRYWGFLSQLAAAREAKP